jgi:hypothetical protein
MNSELNRVISSFSRLTVGSSTWERIVNRVLVR